jgi:formiminotetrahydrofolate cyclodeaminase
MVAGLTVGRKKYAAVDADMKRLAIDAAALGRELSALVPRDSAAYGVVMSAYQLPKETPEQQATRQAAIDEALLGAAQVPLETAQACARVAALATVAAGKGNTNAVSDAGVATLLAEAACRGAVYNVRINVAALSDRSRGADLLSAAATAIDQTRDASEKTIALVEQAIG